MYYWLVFIRLILTTEALVLQDILGLFGLGNKEKTSSVPKPDISTSATYCREVPEKCEESKYRSYDGTCNNLEHSWWATPNTPYQRILAPNYADGISEYPKSVSKKELPNPRTCSLNLYADIPTPDILWTVLFMQYGQLIAHDMSLTGGVAQTDKGGLSCCVNGKLTPEASINPKCLPIMIPNTDPFNAPEGIECKNFYRTDNTQDGRKCINATKVAEPLTVVTGVLDASFTYGSNKELAMKLREGKGGRLKSVTRKERELLPQDPDPTNTCNVKVPTETCFVAGDVRVNQNPQLALLQILYMIQHNSIADALAKVNPHWDDERLYQEARRIVIAKHQYVTYYEYLPPLIGRQNMIKNKLIYPGAKGPVKDYDPNVNPAASIEYASAAFRIFHTEIVGRLKLIKENRNTSSSIQLSDWFNRPAVCEFGNNFNELTIGLGTQPQSSDDRFITDDILNFLFKSKVNGITIGSDLKSEDIHRAREQGCGTYVQALKHFNISNPKSFDDFTANIPPKYVEILKRLYESYLDVDLVVGVSLEKIMLGTTLTGVTGQAIMTEQFYRTRTGDYCFCENGNGKCAFTKEQMNEIRKTTVASILCYNKEIKQMQAEAFKQISLANPLKECSDIHSFDPTAWIEKDPEKQIEHFP